MVYGARFRRGWGRAWETQGNSTKEKQGFLVFRIDKILGPLKKRSSLGRCKPYGLYADVIIDLNLFRCFLIPG